MPIRRKQVRGWSDYGPDEISVLLGNAQITDEAIRSEPDSRERRKLKRDRDSAIDRITQMYRGAEKRGQIDRLDFRVRLFCELLKDRNVGLLPKAKGGRPAAEDHRLLIFLCVEAVIKRLGGKHGDKEKAFREIADRDDLFDKRSRSKDWATRYDYVKEIYYDTDPDFRRTVAVEMDLRRRKIH